MTNIEQKALALAREVSPDDKNRVCKEPTVYFALWEALCRAIERHEAFRLEVSDAVEKLLSWPTIRSQGVIVDSVAAFIIAKPDPLVDAMNDSLDRLGAFEKDEADRLRAALAKRGLEIREREQWNTSSALSSAGSGPSSVI